MGNQSSSNDSHLQSSSSDPSPDEAHESQDRSLHRGITPGQNESQSNNEKSDTLMNDSVSSQHRGVTVGANDEFGNSNHHSDDSQVANNVLHQDDVCDSCDFASGIDDCPICLAPIDSSQSVMRCRNSVRPHYFHNSPCMTQWISSCRASNVNPLCPLCRGPVEVNAARLDEFLAGNGNQSSKVIGEVESNEVGGLLSHLRMSLSFSGDGWSTTALTRENLITALGYVASAAYGFWRGSRGAVPTPIDVDIWSNLSRTARIWAGAGYAGGVLCRLVWSQINRDRISRDGRGGRRSSGSPPPIG